MRAFYQLLLRVANALYQIISQASSQTDNSSNTDQNTIQQTIANNLINKHSCNLQAPFQYKLPNLQIKRRTDANN